MNVPAVNVPPAAQVVLPPDAALVWPSRPADRARLRALSPGAAVALADRRIGGRARLRRQAARHGIVLDAEYVVLPTWGSAAFVADDDPDSLRWLMATFATTPPHVRRGWMVVDVGLRAWLSAAAAGRAGARVAAGVLNALAPAHLAVGRRA